MSVGQSHVMAKYVGNMALAGLTTLWASNVIKCAFITNAVPPALTDSDPRWGVGGAQNYSTNEVPPGGNYPAGGVTLTGCGVTIVAGTTFLNATSPVAVAANPANPTNASWGVIYDSTDVGKHVIGFIDLGGVVSLVPIGISLNINGNLTGTQPVFQGVAS